MDMILSLLVIQFHPITNTTDMCSDTQILQILHLLPKVHVDCQHSDLRAHELVLQFLLIFAHD